MPTPSPSARAVLYEGPGSVALNDAERFAAVSRLLAEGVTVTRLGPGKPLPADDDSTVLVVGRFDPSQPPTPAASTAAPGLRWQSVDAEPPPAPAGTPSVSPPPAPWLPWFPVIDYARCTHCMQCLSFCLFGVYGVDEHRRIQVQNHTQCKTLCPACSRVCPEAAIIFPKYKAGPINGDTVSDADLQREKMKVDISALLGGDVYALLRARSERSRSRFSKERDADQALDERQKCLRQLGELAADIPPEVLRSLPSPEEIARKAAEAAARVASARALPDPS